jgi:hypothetical protein
MSGIQFGYCVLFCRGFAPLHNQSGSLLCAAALYTRIICQQFIFVVTPRLALVYLGQWGTGFECSIVVGVMFVVLLSAAGGAGPCHAQGAPVAQPASEEARPQEQDRVCCLLPK